MWPCHAGTEGSGCRRKGWNRLVAARVIFEMQPMDVDAFAVSATVRPLEQAAKRRRTGQAAEQYMGPGDCVTRETDVLRGHGTYNRAGQLTATLSGTVERINKLVKVQPPKARYVGEVGDIVVGRILEVLPRRWKVDINATAAATLRLDNVQLQNNEQRKRTADDELRMRTYLRESDLVSAEIQEYKQDRSIMLQCRTRNGKLEAGSLVYVPPHLIKRLKHHYHLLPCGVSIILGCNGNVWVAPPPKRAKADGDEKSIMSESAGDAATEVSLSTRETICRVRNAVSAPGSPFWYIRSDLCLHMSAWCIYRYWRYQWPSSRSTLTPSWIQLMLLSLLTTAECAFHQLIC